VKITIYTTALCLIGAAAQAGGGHEQPHGGTTPATITGTQSPGQLQGQLQAQRSTNLNANRNANNNANRNANNNRAAGGAGGQANNGGQTMNYSGGNYSARGNAPDVILGSVSGGNPCGLAAGAGGAFQSVGAAFQKMWEGEGCQTNEDAKLLFNVGLDAVAKERLCESTYYSNAFARAGQPCVGDVQRWQAEWRKQGYRQVGGGWSK
jgi:hypothetical protein